MVDRGNVDPTAAQNESQHQSTGTENARTEEDHDVVSFRGCSSETRLWGAGGDETERTKTRTLRRSTDPFCTACLPGYS